MQFQFKTIRQQMELTGSTEEIYALIYKQVTYITTNHKEARICKMLFDLAQDHICKMCNYFYSFKQEVRILAPNPLEYAKQMLSSASSISQLLYKVIDYTQYMYLIDHGMLISYISEIKLHLDNICLSIKQIFEVYNKSLQFSVDEHRFEKLRQADIKYVIELVKNQANINFYRDPQEIISELSVYVGDSEPVLSVEENMFRSFVQTHRNQILPADSLSFSYLLGAGGFANVYSGIYKRNVNGEEVSTAVAIKRLKESVHPSKYLAGALRELDVLANLQHESLVSFVGFCDDKYYSIVTEKMECGTLKDYLNTTTDPTSLTLIAIEIADGMNYLHENNYLHRDLKSLNILIDANGKPKITDFNITRKMAAGAELMTSTGTVNWTAPEILTYSAYDQKIDVYSFGMVLYEMLTKKVPFEGITADKIPQIVANDKVRPQLPQTGNKKICDLIRSCWHPNPHDRPSFSDILEKFKQENICFDGSVLSRIAEYFKPKKSISIPQHEISKRALLCNSEHEYSCLVEACGRNRKKLSMEDAHLIWDLFRRFGSEKLHNFLDIAVDIEDFETFVFDTQFAIRFVKFIHSTDLTNRRKALYVLKSRISEESDNSLINVVIPAIFHSQETFYYPDMKDMAFDILSKVIKKVVKNIEISKRIVRRLAWLYACSDNANARARIVDYYDRFDVKIRIMEVSAILSKIDTFDSTCMPMSALIARCLMQDDQVSALKENPDMATALSKAIANNIKVYCTKDLLVCLACLLQAGRETKTSYPSLIGITHFILSHLFASTNTKSSVELNFMIICSIQAIGSGYMVEGDYKDQFSSLMMKYTLPLVSQLVGVVLSTSMADNCIDTTVFFDYIRKLLDSNNMSNIDMALKLLSAYHRERNESNIPEEMIRDVVQKSSQPEFSVQGKTTVLAILSNPLALNNYKEILIEYLLNRVVGSLSVSETIIKALWELVKSPEVRAILGDRPEFAGLLDTLKMSMNDSNQIYMADILESLAGDEKTVTVLKSSSFLTEVTESIRHSDNIDSFWKSKVRQVNMRILAY